MKLKWKQNMYICFNKFKIEKKTNNEATET